MGALLIKLLIQVGTPLLLNFVKAGVTTLQARQDNTLGMGADTIHLILKDVNLVTTPAA